MNKPPEGRHIIRAVIRLGHVARFASSGSFGDGYPQLALWATDMPPECGLHPFSFEAVQRQN